MFIGAFNTGTVKLREGPLKALSSIIQGTFDKLNMWNEDQVMTFESFINPPLISFPTNDVWILHDRSESAVVSLVSLKSLSKSFLRSVFYVTFCVWGVWPSALCSPGPDNQRLFLSCDTNMENWRELQRWGWEGRRGKLNKCPTSFHLFGFTFKLGNVQVSKCFNKRERKIVLERQFQTEHK